MAVQSLSKLAIAQSQLEGAIARLYAGEHVAAITLAGAAEEILGQMARGQGQSSALDTDIAAAILVHQLLWGAPTTPKRVAVVANATRNALKHHAPGQPETLTFDPEADARAMIDRATTNYFRVTGDHTPVMLQYLHHLED